MQVGTCQQWIENAIQGLKTGEELLLPVVSKRDSREQFNLFSRELKLLAQIDPAGASEIQLASRFKDHRLWLVLKKIAHSPFIGFKKGRDGEVERVLIKDSSERKRRLLLMKEDGLTMKEIKEIEGNLNQEDLEILT